MIKDGQVENINYHLFVTRFAKETLFVHNFNAHFSPLIKGCSNRITVHVCTIAAIS